MQEESEFEAPVVDIQKPQKEDKPAASEVIHDIQDLVGIVDW